MQGFVKELGLKAYCFPVWGYMGCKQRVFPKIGFPFVAGALTASCRTYHPMFFVENAGMHLPFIS